MRWGPTIDWILATGMCWGIAYWLTHDPHMSETIDIILEVLKKEK